MNAAVTIAALPVACARHLGAPALASLGEAPRGRADRRALARARRRRRSAGSASSRASLAGVALAVAVGAVEPTRRARSGSSPAARSSSSPGSSTTSVHLQPAREARGAVRAPPAIVIAAGLRVELVDERRRSASSIALVWLVGITNAFNLLDNMDGLAATLATVACAYFAIDAATVHDERPRRSSSRSRSASPASASCPFNLRPRRTARASSWATRGSQLLGFLLARARPRGQLDDRRNDGRDDAAAAARARDPDPRHDARHGRAARSSGGRSPRAARDHTSHRLVYYGLSETRGRRAARADRRRARRDRRSPTTCSTGRRITARRRARHVRAARPVRQLPRGALGAGAARTARRHAAPPRDHRAAAAAGRARRRRCAR